ncbi:MAG: two-component sensor histidine kinase [Clostridia bacterium]|nr:two-component sensor histidine kinase [Clostridia bacterium]
MKRRILAYFVRIMAAAIAATTILMTLLTYSMFEKRIIEDLSVDARVLEALLKAGDVQSILNELDDALRVTIVDRQGVVTYDNRVDAAGMDNHLDRPEIAEAMKNGEGRDVRDSRTVDSSTFYYAMRLESGGVLRVAKEAASIWSIYMRALPLILLMTVLMIALNVAVSHVLTDRLVEPIRRLADDMDGVHSAASYPELQPFVRTIRSQHEEILRNANMRVEFTANVSHELKTPLTSISGYAELIESGMAAGEQARHFAGQINKSASRLLTLINDIIRLSQMDSPDAEIECEIVEPGQIAETVIEQLRMSAEKMNVTLKADVRPCMISADRRMMEELIYNLCDNAIRYNVRGGSVRVEVRPVKDKVLLIVQDTGIGISKENQERVFERFYRVDKSRSKATGGTGLGLAIVKHIAAKHGAQIALQSEPGSGTTITVSFDRAGR